MQTSQFLNWMNTSASGTSTCEKKNEILSNELCLKPTERKELCPCREAAQERSMSF
jgi:hypothetical protein